MRTTLRERRLRRLLAREHLPLRVGDAVICAERRPPRGGEEWVARVPAVVVRAVVFRGDCVHVVSGAGRTHRRWRRSEARFVLPPAGAVFGPRGPWQCVLVHDGHDTVVLDCDLFDPASFRTLTRRIRNLSAIAAVAASVDAPG